MVNSGPLPCDESSESALTLMDLFPADEPRPRLELVAAAEVPPPYRQLLVHTHHMTITLESFHRGPVDLQVLATMQSDDWYARRILLRRHMDAEVVQFGIARIRLTYCTPPVRDAILAQQVPLGRVLIDHDVLRHVVPVAFLRVMPGPTLVQWFGDHRGLFVTYGRLGAIHLDQKPAVEVLEIVAPIPPMSL
jgi:hypothetical protein